MEQNAAAAGSLFGLLVAWVLVLIAVAPLGFAWVQNCQMDARWRRNGGPRFLCTPCRQHYASVPSVQYSGKRAFLVDW